jgi:hypothetical protein
VVYVCDFSACVAAEHVLEYKEGACGEDDAAASEGRMDAGFAVEGTAHMNAATTCNAAHVVKLGRGVRLRDLPFLSGLADVSFGFFVDI